MFDTPEKRRAISKWVVGWEAVLRKRTTLQKTVRPLAILLSMVSVLGIFTGIAFLVIPELIDAIQLVVHILGSGLEQLAQME